MKFAILETYEPEETTTTEEETEAPTPLEQKIPHERLVAIIDNAGYDLARDQEISVKEKIARWVELLKWAYPLIGDEYQSLKSQIKESIANPSEWDFTDKNRSYKPITAPPSEIDEEDYDENG